jgi:hypothetical protein
VSIIKNSNALSACLIDKDRMVGYSFFYFVHPIFRFWLLLATKTEILCSLCLHFARQDGQDGKKQIENHTTKVTKILKPKR